MCFGDSVTGVYYHTGGRRAWSDALGLALERLYPGSRPQMINAGVSGNTTAQGLARMDSDVLARDPQLVVVMFGLNDIARGSGPGEFRSNLGQIIEGIRRRGAEVVLMTPNPVYADDPARPPERVAEYAQVVREAGRELGVPVADCFRSFGSVRSVEPRAWEGLMSDSIHPNMRGHELIAEEAALVISGRRLALGDLPPRSPALPRTLSKLRAGLPVRVIAMSPCDEFVGPALRGLFPGARVEVIAWKPDRKGLAEIAEQAKEIGWRRFYENRATADEEPDLVVVAVPAGALAPTASGFHRSYNAILNGALPMGRGGWDFVALLPSALQPDLDPAQRTSEALARDVIEGKDVALIAREQADAAPAAKLFSRRLAGLLGLNPVPIKP